MSLPNLGAMRAVAARLEPLGLPYAFVGGSIVNLLLDHPDLSPARAAVRDLTARPALADALPGYPPRDETARLASLAEKLARLARLA